MTDKQKWDRKIPPAPSPEQGLYDYDEGSRKVPRYAHEDAEAVEEKAREVPPAPSDELNRVAIKHDQGKPGFEFLPMDALGSINEVLRYGAKKYAPHNWEQGFAWTRLGNAILRHTFAWLSGEKLDRETGLPHLAHAGCMLLFALSHQLREIGTNDINPSQTAKVSDN